MVSQNSTWPAVRELDPAVTAAVRVTAVPAATVVTDLPPLVAVIVVVVLVGGFATTTVRGTVPVTEPDVPVMVASDVAGCAELEAVSVTIAVALVGFGAIVAVTPVGRPDTASETSPVNPLTSAIVTVEV